MLPRPHAERYVSGDNQSREPSPTCSMSCWRHRMSSITTMTPTLCVHPLLVYILLCYGCVVVDAILSPHPLHSVYMVYEDLPSF